MVFPLRRVLFCRPCPPIDMFIANVHMFSCCRRLAFGESSFRLRYEGQYTSANPLSSHDRPRVSVQARYLNIYGDPPWFLLFSLFSLPSPCHWVVVAICLVSSESRYQARYRLAFLEFAGCLTAAATRNQTKFPSFVDNSACL